MLVNAKLSLLLLHFSEATEGLRGQFERRTRYQRLVRLVHWEENAEVRKLDGLASKLADRAHVLSDTAPGEMIQL